MHNILLSLVLATSSLSWSQPSRTIASNSSEGFEEINVKKSFYLRQLATKNDELQSYLWQRQFINSYGTEAGYTLFVNNVDNAVVGAAISALAFSYGFTKAISGTGLIKEYGSLKSPKILVKFMKEQGHIVMMGIALSASFGAAGGFFTREIGGATTTAKYRNYIESLNEVQLQEEVDAIQVRIDTTSKEILAIDSNLKALQTSK